MESMKSEKITTRAAIADQLWDYAVEAAEKAHQSNYHTLYAEPDGELSWGDESGESWHRINTYALIKVGTGSLRCNCDWCIADESPEIDSDTRSEFERRMVEALDMIPVGYFED